MRINKFISKTGFCARRKADSYIEKGLVVVNGKIIYDFSYEVQKTDLVSVDNTELKLPEKYTYVMLHKPQGYACTREDPFAEKTIYDLLPAKFHKLVIAGRLDVDSTGLVLLTDDTELCDKITHPRSKIDKEYFIEVKGRLDEDIMKRAVSGVIEKETAETLKIESYQVLKEGPVKSRALVVLHHGKKREIRRLFKILKRYVVRLRRERIGSLKLEALKEGEIKVLKDFDPEEVFFPKAPKKSRRSDYVKLMKKKRIHKNQKTKFISEENKSKEIHRAKGKFYEKFSG